MHIYSPVGSRTLSVEDLEALCMLPQSLEVHMHIGTAVFRITLTLTVFLCTLLCCYLSFGGRNLMATSHFVLSVLSVLVLRTLAIVVKVSSLLLCVQGIVSMFYSVIRP